MTQRVSLSTSRPVIVHTEETCHYRNQIDLHNMRVVEFELDAKGRLNLYPGTELCYYCEEITTKRKVPIEKFFQRLVGYRPGRRRVD